MSYFGKDTFVKLGATEKMSIIMKSFLLRDILQLVV